MTTYQEGILYLTIGLIAAACWIYKGAVLLRENRKRRANRHKGFVIIDPVVFQARLDLVDQGEDHQ